MDINFLIGDLIKKLQNMFVLTKGTEREILANVLLVAKTDGVSLWASDGRLIQGNVSVGAKVNAAGMAVLPLDFLEFLKAIKDNSKAANIRVDGSTLHLTIDNTKATFSMADVNQYPNVFMDLDTSHAIETDKFLQAIKTLNLIASKDPYDKIYFQAKNGVLTLGTTDNFRIVFFDLDCGLSFDARAVPASVLPALMAIGDQKTTQIGFDGATLALECADYSFSVMTLSGLLPTNVLRFYDTPQGKSFDHGDLTAKVRAAGAIADTMLLDLGGHIEARSARSEYTDSFKCVNQGGRFIVNTRHLKDALDLPYAAPVIGVKHIGNRELLHIRDTRMQQYLIPLEEK